MAEQNEASQGDGQGQGTNGGTPAPGAPMAESTTADNQAPPHGVAREGEDERRGEGGYGNDTGFATGSVAPRDDEDESADAGGRSAREQATSDTYRDPKPSV